MSRAYLRRGRRGRSLDGPPAAPLHTLCSVVVFEPYAEQRRLDIRKGQAGQDLCTTRTRPRHALSTRFGPS